jgi:hypothetical protein
MFRSFFVTLAIFLILCTAGQAAETKTEFTQKDFAYLMIDSFSWAAGLPAESSDRDYLLILGGKRNFRYEAENAYNPATDRVTVREHSQFGPFTGKGWLLGVSDTTFATFTLLLPIKASTRQGCNQRQWFYLEVKRKGLQGRFQVRQFPGGGDRENCPESRGSGNQGDNSTRRCNRLIILCRR